MTIVDSSTISPSATRKFAERVRAQGVQYVDAPMTGSKAGAESGTLIFILGGEESAIEKLKPLFAAKLRVDAEVLLPLIQASMVHSGVVEYKAPFVLKRDFSPNFPLRLMHKDLRLALDAAKEARVRLPGLETVEEIYEVAAEDGHGDLDYAATLTLLEKWAGVEVKGASA